MNHKLSAERSSGQVLNDVGSVDLMKLFVSFFDHSWLIVNVTLVFVVFGVVYVKLAEPIFKADALLQIEAKSGGVTSLVGDVGEMIGGASSSSAEIEIIQSRTNLGKTVDRFDLTIVTEQIDIPFVGKGINRLFSKMKGIKVTHLEFFDTSREQMQVVKLVFEGPSGEYVVYDKDGEQKIITGIVGEMASNDLISVFVQSAIAENQDAFLLIKRSRFDAIQWLKSRLSVSEVGLQTGILSLTFAGPNRDENRLLLDDISQNYFLQNVERNSAEAEKSLSFLRGHLPSVKRELTASENLLNKFRQDNESINLSMEAQSTLDVIVSLESKLNDLVFQESEIAKRFTKDHPTYRSILDKRKILLKKQSELNEKVKALPKTQRDVLRMRRDVEVNQQIYVQLLNKVQELNILKAGTVGNVRILDSAESYSNAIKPKKTLIIIAFAFLGGCISLIVVLIKFVLLKGIEHPDEVEALGLAVYASVPMSSFQKDMDIRLKKSNRKSNVKLGLQKTLLAEANPADLTVESLRGLRTSVHFALMDAKNKVVMISGPAPSIGKSFISANFAAIMAKAGLKVLLVDADMRKGYLHKYFSLDWNGGLSDVLSGRLSFAEVIKRTDIDQLDILTRGQVPPNPSELLMQNRFVELSNWASENYDLILIDTPPVLAVTDPTIIGSLAGTTLMVGRFGKNTVKEIEAAKHRFEMSGVNVNGFILNAVEKKVLGSYEYINYSYGSDNN